ncbi:DUF397 domain-containing protein [Streptomyces sp. NA04227]|uniref:DUF397 domain-containing protein n=1 Tax=Streptomyces sp. NA04227 TaxID=2742136 RepID=UPI001590439C|nr:DUF397 domain-containing protein [Streptomyces sp. NA04227]QKW07577.1 DUF397 domain-containing protein [Streptomyces sp. NA04227]
MSSSSELVWFKSSYSSSGSGDCVEVALSWRKSTYSSGDGDDCVEVATCPTLIHIRDSKRKQGPRLAVHPAAWSEFVEYATQG